MLICCKVLLALAIAASAQPSMGHTCEPHGTFEAAAHSVSSTGHGGASGDAVSEATETLADDDDVSHDRQPTSRIDTGCSAVFSRALTAPWVAPLSEILRVAISSGLTRGPPASRL